MGVHVHCGLNQQHSCIITVNLSYSTTCKVKPMCTHTHNHALAPRCVGVTCIKQIQTAHRDWLAHTTAGGTQDLANIHSGCAITEDTAKATSAQSCTRNTHSANFNLHTKEKGTHLCIEFTAVYCHCSGSLAEVSPSLSLSFHLTSLMWFRKFYTSYYCCHCCHFSCVRQEYKRFRSGTKD